MVPNAGSSQVGPVGAAGKPEDLERTVPSPLSRSVMGHGLEWSHAVIRHRKPRSRACRTTTEGWPPWETGPLGSSIVARGPAALSRRPHRGGHSGCCGQRYSGPTDGAFSWSWTAVLPTGPRPVAPELLPFRGAHVRPLAAEVSSRPTRPDRRTGTRPFLSPRACRSRCARCHAAF